MISAAPASRSRVGITSNVSRGSVCVNAFGIYLELALLKVRLLRRSRFRAARKLIYDELLAQRIRSHARSLCANQWRKRLNQDCAAMRDSESAVTSFVSGLTRESRRNEMKRIGFTGSLLASAAYEDRFF